MRIRLTFWGPAALGLAADLLSKHLVFAAWKEGSRHEILGSWLVFQLQKNPGGVFGILPGKGYVFVALSVVALAFVFWMLRSARPEQRLMPVALGLVVAGALGNLHDRLVVGRVRDFIYFEFIRYPAFNVADVCICTAAGLLILEILRGGAREQAPGKEGQAGS